MTKPALTVKQAKFIKAKAEGKTGVQAAMEAYDVANESTARSIASENLAKPSIQAALHAEFEKQGITLERIVRPINDALDASKKEYEKDDEGHWELVGETPDHSTRLKASGMAAQLIGLGKQTEAPQSIHFHQHVAEQRNKYGI